jgi:hypothetical protein
MEYLQQHLKYLFNELEYAYKKQDFEKFNRLRRQLIELREMLNYYEGYELKFKNKSPNIK